MKVSGHPPPDPDVRPQCVGVGFCGRGPMMDTSLSGSPGDPGHQSELDVEAGKGLLQLSGSSCPAPAEELSFLRFPGPGVGGAEHRGEGPRAGSPVERGRHGSHVL